MFVLEWHNTVWMCVRVCISYIQKQSAQYVRFINYISLQIIAMRHFVIFVWKPKTKKRLSVVKRLCPLDRPAPPVHLFWSASYDFPLNANFDDYEIVKRYKIVSLFCSSFKMFEEFSIRYEISFEIVNDSLFTPLIPVSFVADVRTFLWSNFKQIIIPNDLLGRVLWLCQVTV